jgi:hypothetical protein
MAAQGRTAFVHVTVVVAVVKKLFEGVMRRYKKSASLDVDLQLLAFLRKEGARDPRNIVTKKFFGDAFYETFNALAKANNTATMEETAWGRTQVKPGQTEVSTELLKSRLKELLCRRRAGEKRPKAVIETIGKVEGFMSFWEELQAEEMSGVDDGGEIIEFDDIDDEDLDACYATPVARHISSAVPRRGQDNSRRGAERIINRGGIGSINGDDEDEDDEDEDDDDEGEGEGYGEGYGEGEEEREGYGEGEGEGYGEGYGEGEGEGEGYGEGEGEGDGYDYSWAECNSLVADEASSVATAIKVVEKVKKVKKDKKDKNGKNGKKDKKDKVKKVAMNSKMVMKFLKFFNKQKGKGSGAGKKKKQV